MPTWSGTLPSLLAGDIPDATEWQELRNAVDALTAAWNAHSPALANTGFSLSNGTAAGRYIRSGKLIVYTGRVTFGSSTTPGTGTYTVDLPIACRGGTQMYTGSAYFHDADTAANRRPGCINVASTTTGTFISPSGAVAHNSPFTFAQNDYIQWLLIYEPS